MTSQSEKTCDDYISLLESSLKELKSIRQQFLSKKINPPNYEEKTISAIRQIQNSLDGYRHTFLPLSIPTFLQIDKTAPSWIDLSPQQAKDYSKYADENDMAQKDLLRKFRRPGMRRADIQKAMQMLNVQQVKALDNAKWRQAEYIGSILKLQVRIKISPSGDYSSSLARQIQECIDSAGLPNPVDDESASLIILAIFNDETDGPLAEGFKKAKSVEQEISIISNSICSLSKGYPYSKMVELVRPYVADIRREKLLNPLRKSVDKISKALNDAIDILGSDALMADFGTEGVSSLVVTEGLRKLSKKTEADEIVINLQDIGNSAIENSKNKTAAVNMIAAGLISEKLTNFPLNFVYSIAWCSESKLESFTNQPLYIQAFSAIMNVLPNFDV